MHADSSWVRTHSLQDHVSGASHLLGLGIPLAHLKSPKHESSDEVGTGRADQNTYRNPHHCRSSTPNVSVIDAVISNKGTRYIAQPRAKRQRNDFSGP